MLTYTRYIGIGYILFEFVVVVVVSDSCIYEWEKVDIRGYVSFSLCTWMLHLRIRNKTTYIQHTTAPQKIRTGRKVWFKVTKLFH